MTHRRPLFFVLALCLAVFAGCGGDDSNPMSSQPPALPANDTPANTVARFMAAYERRDTTAWKGLFTENFTWEFSAAADPTLAAQYAGGWFKSDESISARNLFRGFTSGGGLVIPAAKSIDVNLSPVTPAPDAGTPDPVRFYQLLTTVDMAVVVPPGPGQTEETTYLIDNNVHHIWFVRGDAVPGDLAADQPADTTHWYIYKWVDETTSTAAASTHSQTERSTWGRLKGLYR